jgi:hypothetical protein
MKPGDEIVSAQAKIVFVQCACGRWRADLHAIEGWMLYGNETFGSKEEAALAMADRLIEMKMENQIGKVH